MSGRNAGSENFPVASRLLPAWARPHVMAFYDFARTADDVADSSGFSVEEKREILTLWGEELQSGVAGSCLPVAALYRSLEQTGVPSRHALDLLKAFRRDADNPKTRDWADLMAYCQLSAAPVGRYLIDLMDGAEDSETRDWGPSDALCAALQILNHIQDIRDDYDRLNRIYMPADWMAEEGVNLEDLSAPTASPGLRRVIDRMLDGVEALLLEAKPLPTSIRTKALAREAGGILAIAWRLTQKLRVGDPLAERVKLSKPHAAMWFLWGALTA